MRLALDTNVLVYAEGLNGPLRKAQARAIIADFETDEIFIPVQVLAELFHVLSRKSGSSPTAVRDKVQTWIDTSRSIDTDAAILADAMGLRVRHHVAWWDAVIVAAAARAGCELLLSEDMQPGFTWRGVTIRNPFAAH